MILTNCHASPSDHSLLADPCTLYYHSIQSGVYFLNLIFYKFSRKNGDLSVLAIAISQLLLPHEKWCSLQKPGCEIKGGDQEMAVIMLMLINFNNGCALLKLTSYLALAGLHL